MMLFFIISRKRALSLGIGYSCGLTWTYIVARPSGELNVTLMSSAARSFSVQSPGIMNFTAPLTRAKRCLAIGFVAAARVVDGRTGWVVGEVAGGGAARARVAASVQMTRRTASRIGTSAGKSVALT